ncbi:hypothetical protein FB45DRAFT_798945 [Roridomyces roridus]|uniref:Uncharacterized protein n=1 Tax=Roridomyces roridus TaxID=1738132 RepID=A0AAD7BHC9_9AGAR|nr:hypothetical protein FB45DRAFT_798945 [Roridomyces roridus]
MPVSITPPAQLPPPKPDHSFTKRPSSFIAVFFWRWRMWVESTFALSMLEPWEKILLITIFSVLFFLICSGIVMYFPRHLRQMHGRVMYYLWGQEGDERLLWQWLGLGGGLHKEL